MIPTDVHQSNESALFSTGNRKDSHKVRAVESAAVIPMIDLSPVHPVHRRLDLPGIQMFPASATII
jgi:hypothetical protein